MAVGTFCIIPPGALGGPVAPCATRASGDLGLAPSRAMPHLLAFRAFQTLEIAGFDTDKTVFIVSYAEWRDGGIK